MTFEEWFKEANWGPVYGDDSDFHYGASVVWDYKQVEIDALNALGEMSEQKIDDLVLRNIELQKRIDSIVDLVRDNTPDYYLDNVIQDILKGDKND